MPKRPPPKPPNFVFDWPVDQYGHFIDGLPTAGATVLGGDTEPVLRRRGGPDTMYRPLETKPGLWREFGDTSRTDEGAKKFANEFGLLFATPDGAVSLHLTVGLAYLFSRVGLAHEKREFDKAAALIENNLLKRERPHQIQWTATFARSGKTGRREFAIAPFDLLSCMIIQATDAISKDQKFRKCRNPDCTAYILVGKEGRAATAKYCDGPCRAAAGRRRQQPLRAAAVD